MNPSGERGTSDIRGFVQQSHLYDEYQRQKKIVDAMCGDY